MVIILDWNFWDILTIIIALDYIYKDFDIITTNLLQIGDKKMD